jgi:ornithine carbamoyltransferase
VVLAHPEGLELHSEIIEMTKKNAIEGGWSFEISNNMDDAFEGVDVVYPKSWGPLKLMPPNVPEVNAQDLEQYLNKHKNWITTNKRLSTIFPKPLLSSIKN